MMQICTLFRLRRINDFHRRGLRFQQEGMTNQPHQVFKNTVALAVSRLVEKCASVCLSFFIARYLGAAALGVYAAVIVFFALISLAAEMGSTTFLVREISRDRTRTSAYLIHFSVLTI